MGSTKNVTAVIGIEGMIDNYALLIKRDMTFHNFTRIDGDVELYITGNITLGNSAEIQVLHGGSLTIFSDGNVEGKNSSRFTNKSK